MKNQYFGDVNDYKKYGLLRLLNGCKQIRTAVCWMLTPNDLRTDGHRIDYLRQPEKWGSFDPIVYEFLRKQVIECQIRNVNTLESSNVLPNCRFYSEVVQDNAGYRKEYLKRFLEFAHGSTLVFFDPDNGMEVKSTRLGRKNSSKYLYWTEVEKSYSAGHSLLVYQHLPPKPREPFIRNLADRFRAVTGVSCVYSYRTQFVVFFLIPQSIHRAVFALANRRVKEVWGKEIKVEKHELHFPSREN